MFGYLINISQEETVNISYNYKDNSIEVQKLMFYEPFVSILRYTCNVISTGAHTIDTFNFLILTH